MKQYKIHKLLLLIFLLVLNINIINAQENTPVSKIVKVKKDVLCQIDFTTEFEAEFYTPKDNSEFYEIDKTNSGKAITINTKQESLPPTILIVKEKNGKIWNITLEYKEDLDPENEAETNYDFADNTTDSKKAVNTITLTPTMEKKKFNPQKEYIPYNTQAELAELKKLYPDFDFNHAPPEQTVNLAVTDNDEVFIYDLYDKRAELTTLAFTSDLIKIICENLVFKETNGYLKLLIQNDTEQEFLTGNMLLSIVRQNGSVLKLHPGSISPKQFPIIKPGFQKAIIYSFKAYDVADEDDLKFEIHDRFQKLHLEFKIPGTEFNKINKN